MLNRLTVNGVDYTIDAVTASNGVETWAISRLGEHGPTPVGKVVFRRDGFTGLPVEPFLANGKILNAIGELHHHNGSTPPSRAT